MAFGFPAYHTESFSTTASPTVVRGAVLAAIDSLGWSLKEESDHEICARVGFNFWSSGEQIEIRLLPLGRLSITSKCWMPTQCFDWGKNEENVTRLISELRKAIGLARLTEGAMVVDSDEARGSRNAGSEHIQDRIDRIQ